MLTDILSRFTKMPVHAAKNRMPVELNHVYVIPPGTIITFENKVLKLNPKGQSLKPIDTFLTSLSEDFKTQSIGIVLSGTGSDGTEGLRAIKAQGGITFAQTPESAQYPDMPKSAISADVADFVLSPKEIAYKLQKIAKNPQIARTEMMTKEETTAKKLKKKKETVLAIFSSLKSKFNVDFSHYKETVVKRRVSRRMVINHIESIAQYAKYLREHSGELEALYNDMLIGVTNFFREPETFEILKETVFQELMRKRSLSEPIRIWIPGCSTGEEVYSFAIAINEYFEKTSKKSATKFGTDVNEKT
jgi:two-component system CheB/CheR fusion protein